MRVANPPDGVSPRPAFAATELGFETPGHPEGVARIFVWVVGESPTYAFVYGSLAAIIALMTWSYVSATILLFCAKLTSIYPKVRASVAAEVLAEESAKEQLLRLAPSASMIFINMSSLTSGGVGALRRLMLGKG